MESTINFDNELQKISPVLDDHAEWYGQALRRIFYPELYRTAEPLVIPESFDQWIAGVEKESFIEKSVVKGLKRVHDDLKTAAVRGMGAAKPEEKLEAASYDTIADLYEGFIVLMRRFQYDAAQVDGGIDPATSLRNKRAMTVELERELERRARRGRPFCLAMASIDNFDVICAHASEDQIKTIMATLGRLIHKCIRSFDDGYRSAEAEFVMSLKHADSAGGTSAIARLRGFLNQEKLEVPDGQGNMLPLTMSYCVAEPVPGDTLDDLMKNMRQDLERYREGGNASLQYFEQSPLSRLIRTMDTNK
jgi:diguanylate cyclase (GGDEF)-like protein